MNRPLDSLDQIGKYRINSTLGKGAMGTVYRAFDTIIEREVAIKVLHAHLIDGDEGDSLLQRFKQEAQAAARCLHPNITAVFDYGIEKNTPYIVMEYIEGAELKDAIQSQKLFSINQSVQLIQQILSALDTAHNKGIIHRDIKPANIILLNSGQVKVADFGVARLDSSDLTQAGYMVGTPNYMSPEGLRGQTVDARSDLYSCALVFLEVLTLMKPCVGHSTDELLEQLSQRLSAEQVPYQPFETVITTALNEQPDLRYQTAREFSEALSTLIDQHDLSTSGDPYTVITSKPLPAYTSTWQPQQLQVIEDRLVSYIGPVANTLIRKHSKSTSGITELLNQLAEYIPSEPDRNNFIQSIRKEQRDDKSQIHSISKSNVQPPPQEIEPEVTDEQISKIKNALMPILGPISPKLVKMEAKRCTSVDQLINRLCEHIPDTTEQAAFKKHCK